MNRAVARNDIDVACHIVWHVRWWAVQRLRLEIGEWADAVLGMPGAARHPLVAIVSSVSAEVARRKFDWRKYEQRLTEAEEREKSFGDSPEPWVPETRVLLEAILLDADPLPSVTELQRRSEGSPFWETLAACRDALVPSILLAATAPNDTPDPNRLRRVQHCRTLAEGLGNPSLIARASNVLGGALGRIDPATAITVLEGALATAQAVGNETVQVDNRVDLAMVCTETGRSKEALAMQRDAIRLYTRAGAWQQAHDAALSTFRALVSLGERRAACLLAGSSATPPLATPGRVSSLPNFSVSWAMSLGRRSCAVSWTAASPSRFRRWWRRSSEQSTSSSPDGRRRTTQCG